MDLIIQRLKEAQQCLDGLMKNQETLEAVQRASQGLAECLKAGGQVLSCGNGGSMSDAMHFAEELSGRFRGDRRPLRATAISDPGYLTCVANDFGYEKVFARFVEAHGQKGDYLLAISTSGTSSNVLAAAQQAKTLGMSVIGLMGKPGSPLEEHCDFKLVTPGGRYADRVQELHIKLIHIIIELVEAELGEVTYAARDDL